MSNYIVYAQPPTAVTASAVASFTGKDDRNLLLGKVTRLEILQITEAGLVPFLELPYYGRIFEIIPYRPPVFLLNIKEEDHDLIFVITEDNKISLLSYDPVAKEIVTRANGNLSETGPRPADSAPLSALDETGKQLCLHLFEGSCKVLGLNGAKLDKPVSFRLEEQNVQSMVYLKGQAHPTLALLFQDSSGIKRIRFYEVNLQKASMVPALKEVTTSITAKQLVALPAPHYGLLVFAEDSISCISVKSEIKSVALASPWSAAGIVDADGSRFLVSCENGQILLLLLNRPGSNTLEPALEYLGDASIGQTISYLDNGVFYLGSRFGDSQLLRLLPEKNEDGTYVELLDTFTNLGPIVDMCLVDLDRQGQSQIITCSGFMQDGSLRIIRNGIGLTEHASAQLPGIKGLWSLKSSLNERSDKYMVVSFVGATRTLSMSEDDLQEVDLGELLTSEQTLYAGNLIDGVSVQITSSGVYLFNSDFKRVGQYQAPGPVHRCAANAGQILLAMAKTLIYLEVVNGQLEEKARAEMEFEIACLDCTTFEDGPAHTCTVGLWSDFSVRILQLPNLRPLLNQPIADVVPRSVLLAKFEDSVYLLVGLGDGRLWSARLSDDLSVNDVKCVALGTTPLTLTTIQSAAERHVFAACDRPTVIYSSNHKLVYSSINSKDVTQVSQFNSENYPQCLAISTENDFSIVSLDDIQKLHIQSHPLGEMPRRIAYHPGKRLLCVGTSKLNSERKLDSFIRLFDEQTLEVLTSFELEDTEEPTCISTYQAGPTLYFVVGTCFQNPSIPEPDSGRILIFNVDDGKLILESKTDCPGSVYAVAQLDDKLVAAVNGRVRVFAVQSEGLKLNMLAEHTGHIVVLFLEVRQTFILVGDMMRSICLLNYDAAENKLTEVSRDYEPDWVTSVGLLDEETFFSFEYGWGVVAFKRNVDDPVWENRLRLQTVGRFHLGEMVNALKQGSLVMSFPDVPAIPSMLFGCVSGAIGVLGVLTGDDFKFLNTLQTSLRTVIKGIGGFSNAEWRARKATSVQPAIAAHGFIDGDLVEEFLNLPLPVAKQVADDTGLSLEDITKRVETIVRALH